MSASIRSILSLLAASVLALAGCASAPHKNLTHDQIVERSKRTAIAAVQSPEAWKPFETWRLTRGPYTIDPVQEAARMAPRFFSVRANQFYDPQTSYHPRETQIILTVKTGARVGLHSTFVDVAIPYGTDEVVGMREYFYP